MAQLPVNAYTDPTNPAFVPVAEFLPDEDFPAAHSAFVKVCTDTILISRRRRTVYLATRCVYPMKGLWILGGKLSRGRGIVESMCHILKRETGFDVDPARLEFLSQNRMWWAIRKEMPVTNGTDDLSFMFAFDPTIDELHAIEAGLVDTEYDTSAGLREFTYEQLLEADVAPIILDLYRQIFPQSRLRAALKRLLMVAADKL